DGDADRLSWPASASNGSFQGAPAGGVVHLRSAVMRTVLICGAGVAGPTLAYWLARAGFRPTIVERADGQRSSGSPVDVRGPALPVVERMGVVDALRAAATQATGVRFVDSSGRLSRRMSMPSGRSAAGTPEPLRSRT